MTEHDVTDKQIAQHRGADLAGERAASLPVHVLRADLDVLHACSSSSVTFAMRGERRHDDDVDVANVADFEQESFDEPRRLA